MRRLLCCIKLDMVEGFRSAWPCLIAAMVLQALNVVLLDSSLRAMACEVPISLVDCGTYALGGIKEPVQDEMSRLAFPVAWVLFFMLLAYASLTYPRRDLDGFGRCVVVASGGRWVWWTSKCLWVCAASFLVVFSSVFGACVAVVALGGELFGPLHAEAVQVLPLDFGALRQEPWDVGPFFLSAMAVVLVFSLVQLAFSFLVKPVFAYAACVASLFVSVFISTPFLPGEYCMAARSGVFIDVGCDPYAGLLYAAGLAVLSFVSGGLLFAKSDIVGKEIGE